LPLATTAGNGKIAIQSGGLSIASGGSNNLNVTVDSTAAPVGSVVRAADSSMTFDGALTLSNGSSSTSTLVLNNVSADFAGGTFNMANGSAATATLNMNNSTLRNVNGGMVTSRNNSTNTVATLNLTNSSTLELRGNLQFGADTANGIVNFNLDST